MPTIKVTESKWSDRSIDLNDQQADALRRVGERLAGKGKFWGDPALDEDDESNQKSVLELKKMPTSGYKIYIRNAIGSIGIDDLTIHVEPKIGKEHFKYILNQSESVPRDDHQQIVLPEDSSLAQVVAQWFIQATEKLLKRGLLKNYRELSDSLPYARGRIRPLQTARHFYSGRTLLDVDFEEFDQDTPLNRLIKAAALSIAKRSLFSKEIRVSARRIMIAMEDVSKLRPTDIDARTDRQTKSYEEPIDLAKRVLRSQGIFSDHGSYRAWAFLLPTPLLVESGIRNILQHELRSHFEVRKQGLALSNSKFTLNPDLVFQMVNTGNSITPALMTGDVKYKIKDFARSDLYQAVTFATHYEANHALVISFSNELGNSIKKLEVGPKTINFVCWNYDMSITPDEACADLVKTVREILNEVVESSSKVLAVSA